MCDNDTSFELFEFNELNFVNKLAEQGFFVVIMKTSLCLSVCLPRDDLDLLWWPASLHSS